MKEKGSNKCSTPMPHAGAHHETPRGLAASRPTSKSKLLKILKRVSD